MRYEDVHKRRPQSGAMRRCPVRISGNAWVLQMRASTLFSRKTSNIQNLWYVHRQRGERVEPVRTFFG